MIKQQRNFFFFSRFPILLLFGMNLSLPLVCLEIDESVIDPGKKLTLIQAINRVLTKNPELPLYKWEIEARQGLIEQESLYPNPEFAVEVENIAGTKELKSFKGAESTFIISQDILLGPKRQRRIEKAGAEKTISVNELAMKRLDLVAVTKKRYLEVLFWQKKCDLKEKMAVMTGEFAEKISARISAGKSSPAELSLARINILKAGLAADEAGEEWLASQRKLAALWGSSEIDFNHLEGNWEDDPVISSLEDLEKEMQKNVDLKIQKSRIDLCQSALNLEKSLQIPDLSVFGGIRHLNELGGLAFTFGFSLPIPLSNRNQGVIKAFQYLKNKAEEQYQVLSKELALALKNQWDKVQITLSTCRRLKNDILPMISETYQLTIEGYSLGRFGYLDVLGALKTRFETEEEYLEYRLDLWSKVVDLERMVGSDFRILGQGEVQ